MVNIKKPISLDNSFNSSKSFNNPLKIIGPIFFNCSSEA